VTPSGPCRPSSSRRHHPRLEAAAALLVLSACARAALPSPEVVRAASQLSSYSASLQVSVSGGALRGRSRALVAFRRPDALRIELPGPSGARLVAVTRAGRLTAVLPSERAVLEAEASAAGLESLIGIALRPDELMDLLVGVAPAGAREYEARWGRTLPRRVDSVLGDGTKVRATVEEADAGGDLAVAAFDAPPHEGYRAVDADEARRLLGGR
jgi:hypothetical protein